MTWHRTRDGQPIVAGLRVFTSDGKWGTVTQPGEYDTRPTTWGTVRGEVVSQTTVSPTLAVHPVHRVKLDGEDCNRRYTGDALSTIEQSL